MIQEVDPYALSKCRSVDELTEWLDLIVREAGKPLESLRHFRAAELRNAGLREICPIVLAAAVRIATAERIAEPVPLDDADPLRAILRLRQWCARATSALQAVETLPPAIEKSQQDARLALISTTVAVARYVVSRATLRRAVADGVLKDFRQSGHSANAPLMLNEAQIAGHWTRRR